MREPRVHCKGEANRVDAATTCVSSRGIESGPFPPVLLLLFAASSCITLSIVIHPMAFSASAELSCSDAADTRRRIRTDAAAVATKTPSAAA